MGTNAELAAIFQEIGDLLDLAGEKFKPDAYRRAARSIESLTEDIRRVQDRGELDSIPGVGAAISEKIREFLSTGSLEYLTKLRRSFPPGLLDIVRLPGVGPKTARRFWLELGVEGTAELAAAVATGRLVGLAGFGPKKIELLRKALAEASPTPARRTPLLEADELARRIVATLRATAPLERIEVAGSLRRAREDVGDLDILVTSAEPEKVFDAFGALPGLREVRLRGPTKSTVVVAEGVQVDLRVVEPAAFGAAWQYFTGSKDHNVHLRSLARDRGLKINEYGVYRGDERIAGASEDEVYAALELPAIPPEIREDRGEIEAAAAGRLPKLVEASDLRGDLHVHLEAGLSEEELDLRTRPLPGRSVEYLGLVLDGGGPAERERVRRRLEAREIRAYFGAEVGAGDVAAPRPPGVDYLIVRAGPLGPDDRAVPSERSEVLLVGHWGAGTEMVSPETAGAWIRWALQRSAAFDVPPPGLDGGPSSGVVRQVVDAGGLVHLSRAVLEGSGASLSVRTARRGWATASGVINAQGRSAWDRRWRETKGPKAP